MTVYTKTRRTN